ncbi:MAG: C40 family peptidase [Chitinophagaceae bacterium]
MMTLFKQQFIVILLAATILVSCTGNDSKEKEQQAPHNRSTIAPPGTDTMTPVKLPKQANAYVIATGSVHPDTLLAFARTLIGVPYLYASTDPANGFDCSGFINYVFNHFNIAVPRSSVDFTNIEKEVDIKEAGRGDLILFTGTDSTIRVVGHMGIVEGIRNDSLYFIHSTSGKAKGVVITAMGNYYRSRFVKTIRIFPQEFFE